jgi:hypothetical protein
MDNENSATAKVQPNATQSAEKSETLTEACTTIEDESQKIFAARQDNIGKPKTLTEACLAMKEESIDEAKRLVPNKR